MGENRRAQQPRKAAGLRFGASFCSLPERDEVPLPVAVEERLIVEYYA